MIKPKKQQQQGIEYAGENKSVKVSMIKHAHF